jgi:hypothetical protein
MGGTELQTRRKKLMHAIRLTSSAIALAALLAPAAFAQDTAEVRRLTIMTFSEPIQVPGKTLPAGTYRFEMADINNAPHVVRVLSEDGQTVIGTFHTVPSTLPQRDLADQNTLLMFAERPAGQPQAAREWFYPGRSIGEEFVYPKEQAVLLANANKTSVAVEEADGRITRVEPVTGQTAANQSAGAASAGTAATAGSTSASAPAASTTASSAPSAAPVTSGAQSSQSAANENASQAPATASEQERTGAAVGTSGQSSTQPPSAPAQSTTAGSQAQGTAQNQTGAPAPARTLPQTASQFYWFGLLSVMSLGAAFGFRQLRLRTSRG